MDELHMNSTEVRTHRRQKFRLFKGDTLVGIGECVLSYSGLIRLPQTTLAIVFINARTDKAFRSSNVQPVTRARNSVHSARRERVPDVLHRSQKLLDCLGRLEDSSYAVSAQQLTNTISYPRYIGQRSEANIRLRQSDSSVYDIKLKTSSVYDTL